MPATLSAIATCASVTDAGRGTLAPAAFAALVEAF
jgi:hypothetical protein